ncbi:MFS transporter [Rhodobium gokarnense]|uniref:MFS family permease n=1 Tax=Rhodobium gokarnense TaxID=364296 RepID=A0ABT3H7G0_9HYPH|nr:MFS transporter [Rhodobium gokarnense]MCW2306333.1 MFS family permease [Rhodobium gokarnense]
MATTLTNNDAAVAAEPAKITYSTRYVVTSFVIVTLGWCLVNFSNTFQLAVPGMMEEMQYTSTQIGLVASVFSFGGFFSALWLPLVADRHGRKIGMALSVAMAVVFNSMIGLTHSIVALLPLRFLSSHGQTCQWGIGASHLSEIAPARMRGTLLGLMQAGTPLGFFMCAALFTTMMSMGFTWRAFSMTAIVAVLIIIPILFVLQESQQWKAARAEVERLKALGKETVEDPNQKKVNIRELFKPAYRKNTFIAMTLHSLGAFWAWGNVTWFLVALSQDFGMDAVTRGRMSMLMWGIAVFSYALAGRVGDLIGRRAAMLVFSLLIMCGASTMYFSNSMEVPNVQLLYVATALIGTGVGLHSILIAYSSEIFPTHVRATGTSIAIGIGRLTAVFSMMGLGIVAQQFSPTTAELTAAIGALLMVPTIYIFGMETARKELTEIVR